MAMRALATMAVLGTIGFAGDAVAQTAAPADGRYRLFEGFMQQTGIKAPIMIDTISGRTWVLRPAVDGQLRWSRILLERLGPVPDGLLAVPPDISR